RAQRQRAKFRVAHLEDEAGRSPAGVRRIGDAAEVGQHPQRTPEYPVFRQVGQRARVVLELSEQSPCQLLPGTEACPVRWVENDGQQLRILLGRARQIKL